MSSTGEVGCLGDDFNEALLNALIATGYKLPKKGVLISSGPAKGKVDMLDAARLLVANGYKVYATEGTARFLLENHVETTPVSWPDEEPLVKLGELAYLTKIAQERDYGKEVVPVMQLIANHDIDLIVNVPKNHTKRELTNGYKIRRAAIDHNIPLMTNVRLAKAFIEAFCSLKEEDIPIKSWQEYEA